MLCVLNITFTINVIYDEKDAIGRRYRRQDANGTPFCITVDHQTLQDNTVTLRERDSMSQERIEIKDLAQILSDSVSMKSILKFGYTFNSVQIKFGIDYVRYRSNSV